ncbi:SusC/RagA family TonB-linked outer membrane protein [Aquimarina sp. M1]
MKTFTKSTLFLLWLIPMSFFAQSTVNGTVTDATNGQPIPGVNIIVKGTTNGTSSDFDGNYTLSGVNNGDIIEFSYVGFVPQEFTYSGNARIDVGLQVDAAELEQVVVIGYGSVRKKDLTGSVTTVTADDFNQGVTTSPDQLIKGRTAGVTVIDNGGAPGEGSTIRIRGGSSLNASNNPLIIVDGVPLDPGPGGTRNNLNSINPNDIESFTVLKDASATAIYGFRASNGVIIITTKKGTNTDGKLKFNYNGNVTFSEIVDKIEALNGDQFREYVTANGSQAQIDLLGTENTDWQDEILQNAVSTNHNVSLASGWDWINYRVSLGLLSEEGLIKTDQLDRTSLSANIRTKFFDNHLRINSNIKTAVEDYTYATTNIGAALGFDPTQPVFQENNFGNYFQWLDGSGNPIALAGQNPLAALEQNDSRGLVFRSLGNLEIDYKFHFLPELRANVNVGYEIASAKTENITSARSVANSARTGNDSFSRSLQKRENLLFDFYLNYRKDVESLNTIFDVTAGYSYQKFLDSGSNFSRGFDLVEIDNPFNNPREVLLGFFGRATISIADKYIFTGSFRRDATSRFSGLENQWTNSPSGAFSWNAHNENFLKESSLISQLKFRVSYGVTPQQSIGDATPSLPRILTSGPGSQYQIGQEPDGTPIFISTGLALPYNPDLTWETTTQYNVGLDFGLYNGRVSGTVDLYRKETDDLLFVASLPSGSLANADDVNLGNLTNEGLEFSLNVVPVQTDNLKWTVGGNITFQKGEVTELFAVDNPNFEGFFGSGFVGSNINIQTVGFAPSSYWVFEQIYDANGRPVEGAYVDRNNDNVINEKDKYIYRKPAADFFYGFNTTLDYKNWNFSMFWRGSVGNYNYNFVDAGSNGRRILNFQNTLSNTTTDLLDTGFFDGGVDRFSSDYYIQDASFLKLDNISLGYTFKNFLNYKNIDMKLYGTVNNVLIITDYTGIDPEISSGFDQTIYPRPRTYQFGVNLDF